MGIIQNLSLFLQDYKDLVGTVAGIVTIGQFLSGAFICKDIYKKGSSNGVPHMPFVGGIIIGTLMLQYSLLLNDSAMLTVNISAILLNIFYLSFYIFYSSTIRDILKSLSKGAVLIAVLIGYTKIENPEVIEYRFGFIVTTLMFMLIASPLFAVNDIIKNKDASNIPFPMVLSGSLVSFLWLLYGIILLNDFMIFQNVVGLVLCAVQLKLCFMYPGPPVTNKKGE